MHAGCGTEKLGDRIGATEEWGISTVGVGGNSIALHCIADTNKGVMQDFQPLLLPGPF